MSAPSLAVDDSTSQPGDTSESVHQPRWAGWLAVLTVTAFGGFLRFWQLGRPDAVVFDETYYAKDALSLLRFGHERQAIDGADQVLLDGHGNLDVAIFEPEASFVVHPPVGKWTIGLGELLFGADPFGWRFAVAVLGTVSILLLARAVWLMTKNPVWGCVAGFLLAIDGVAIVMSRTAILDGVLAFFILAAFLALIKDRLWGRERSVHKWSWWRPYRLLMAILLGLACGVKWSGLWFVIAFCIMTVLWEVVRRFRGGVDGWRTLLADGIPAAVTILPIIVLVYLLGWTGWFLTDGGWDRNWAGDSGILAALQGLWHYHAEMMNFHTGLGSEHSYQSPAWGWLVQARPTSFYFESLDAGAPGCVSGNCSAEVIALGNPLIWWGGTLALVHQTWRWLAVRDWRSGAMVVALLAGWAPWLLFPDRTIFGFYKVVFTPFLIGALTLSLATIVGPVITRQWQPITQQLLGTPANTQTLRVILAGVFLLGALIVSWFMYPIWTGEVIDQSSWTSRMWFNSWI